LDGEIPWIIGKDTMKKMNLQFDWENEEILMKFPEEKIKVKYRKDNKGHIRCPLRNMKREGEEHEKLYLESA